MMVVSFRITVFLLFQTFLLVYTYSFSTIASEIPSDPIDGGGLASLSTTISHLATAPPSDRTLLENSSFILAAERTRRKDPLNGFKYYTGGWNISEKHYWASVGFSAAPLFLIAAIWFLVFGLALLLICCCYCCCPRREYSYSSAAHTWSLIFLILFTVAAIIGSIVLYNGQGKFQTSTSRTLDYVVGQANYTAENLRNFTDNLAAAKKVRVATFILPADVQSRIGEIETKLNSSAADLAMRTDNNSKKIHNVLDIVRLLLIIIAAVMLLLAFLGFLFSILGLQVIVSVLMLIGWIIIAGTFILGGVFLLLHNVVSDTCVAMDEWVQNPHAHTALDDVLPCVDVATANESLYQSKEVTFLLVNVVNQVIDEIANAKSPAESVYNQSGPFAPNLCNPFAPDLTNRKCVNGEVDFSNAAQVWKSYICSASGLLDSEICTSVGRFTPDMYGQITATTNVSFGLYHYGPFLTQLEDCTFVRETFSTISSRDCPGLGRYSRWVYLGLAMDSAAVMLSLILWVIYARERQHRKYNRQYLRYR